MRHKKGFNHLGRKSNHRKAMLANMASSLIMHKRINTTVAKAKALKQYLEPLITKSKEDTTHSRRIVFSYLQDKYAVTELFREISPKIADRPGGYTRILKTGSRLGDNADMCVIELVDYNENLLEAKEQKKKTTRRRRGGSSKPKEENVVATEKTTAEVDTPKKEETKEEVIEDIKEEKKEEVKKEEPKVEEKKEEVKKEEPKAEEKKEEVKKEEPKAEEKKEEKPEETKEKDNSEEEEK